MWYSDRHFALSIPDRFNVGQNLFMNFSSGPTPDCIEDWAPAVHAWYDEVKDFNNSHVSPFQ
jgi:hypothetical protein